MARSLQQEGQKTIHLCNHFNFVPKPLPEIIECDIEVLKLFMVHNPMEIQIGGMFNLNYFILYAMLSGGAEYMIMLMQFKMAS